MEKWKEVFNGIIPVDIYQVEIINGEETGLIIKLLGRSNQVIFKFGVVLAVRMFEEGVVQVGVYSDYEIEKFKDSNFQNVIYEVQNGEFGKKVLEISGGYLNIFDLKHYIMITQNYNLDIITEFEPDIEILQV